MLSAVARRRLQTDGDTPLTQQPLSLDGEEANIKKRRRDATIGNGSPNSTKSKRRRRQPDPELTSSESSEHGETGPANQFSSFAAYVQPASEIGRIEELARGRVRAIVAQGKVCMFSVNTVAELTIAENFCHWVLPAMGQVRDGHDLWCGLVSFRGHIQSLCAFLTFSTSC